MASAARKATPRRSGASHEPRPDDERETEQQDRLAAMVGEEAGDAVASRRARSPAGRAVEAEDGLGGEIAHAANGRAAGGQGAAAAGPTRPRRAPGTAAAASPRCSLRIDARARDCRNAVVLSIGIRLGCWPVVEEECSSRTTFSGGTAVSRNRLNMATGSGGTSAGERQASGGPPSLSRKRR